MTNINRPSVYKTRYKPMTWPPTLTNGPKGKRIQRADRWPLKSSPPGCALLSVCSPTLPYPRLRFGYAVEHLPFPGRCRSPYRHLAKAAEALLRSLCFLLCSQNERKPVMLEVLFDNDHALVMFPRVCRNVAQVRKTRAAPRVTNDATPRV